MARNDKKSKSKVCHVYVYGFQEKHFKRHKKWMTFWVPWNWGCKYMCNQWYLWNKETLCESLWYQEIEPLKKHDGVSNQKQQSRGKYYIFTHDYIFKYYLKCFRIILHLKCSITIACESYFSRLFFRSIELTSYIYIWENYRLIILPWDSPWTWYLTFLGVDLGYYWFHRMAHGKFQIKALLIIYAELCLAHGWCLVSIYWVNE